MDLGAGAVSTARVVAVGPMGFLHYRCKVGADADLGSDPLILAGSDLPSGYQPRLPDDDIAQFGQNSWGGGWGFVFDASKSPSEPSWHTFLTPWVGFDNVGIPTPVMMWPLTGPGDIVTLSNIVSDSVPYAGGLAENAVIVLNTFYELSESQVGSTAEDEVIPEP